VDQIREGLGPGSTLVKIRALSHERIRRNYALGFELIVTYGTTKLDLTQRCHSAPTSISGNSRKWRRNICASLY
jgi:hypothetical protein